LQILEILAIHAILAILEILAIHAILEILTNAIIGKFQADAANASCVQLSSKRALEKHWD
jgi:hypothetical protein